MFDVGSTLSDHCLQMRCHVLHHFGKCFLRNVLDFSVDVFLQLIKSLRPRVSIDPVLEIPHKKKSGGVRSGEYGGHSTSS